MFKKKYKKFISIEGMQCERCGEKIYSSLSSILGVIKVKVQIQEKSVIVLSKEIIPDTLLMKKIEELGYQVNYIKVL